MKGNGVENKEIFLGSWDVFECISGNMCTLNLVWCRLQFNVHHIHILHTSCIFTYAGICRSSLFVVSGLCTSSFPLP